MNFWAKKRFSIVNKVEFWANKVDHLPNKEAQRANKVFYFFLNRYKLNDPKILLKKNDLLAHSLFYMG